MPFSWLFSPPTSPILQNTRKLDALVRVLVHESICLRKGADKGEGSKEKWNDTFCRRESSNQPKGAFLSSSLPESGGPREYKLHLRNYSKWCYFFKKKSKLKNNNKVATLPSVSLFCGAL